MTKLKTLKDIEKEHTVNKTGDPCDDEIDFNAWGWSDIIRQVAREWVEECKKGMDNADEKGDRETFSFFAGKVYAFVEFFNLEDE